MSLLALIGRGVLVAAALGSFGWGFQTGSSTTLGLMAAGAALVSLPRLAVPCPGE